MAETLFEGEQLALEEGDVSALGCKLVVYGLAIPGGSKVALQSQGQRRPFVVDSNRQRVQPWRQEVAGSARKLMELRHPFEGPLSLQVEFFLPRPKGHFGARGLRPSAPRFPTSRPDTTKLLRPVEDALTGILWRDDAQIVEQHVRKLYGEPSRMVLRLRCMV